MAKKIEILENTLLKLLVRRGTDADRKQIILSEGELGYATDTERLYIGNGSDAGGIITGNKFLGSYSTSDFLTITEATSGDLAYDIDRKALYASKGNGEWDRISTSTDAGDFRTVVDAGDVEPTALGDGLVLDGNLRVAVDCNGVKTNQVSTCNSNYLKLPQQLQLGNKVSQQVKFPDGRGQVGQYLQTDGTGNLKWAFSEASTSFLYNTQNGPVPVGSIMPFTSNTNLPTGWLLCDGSEVLKADYPDLSGVLGDSYGAASNADYFKLPNYLNKALYGVDDSPGGSTVYDIGSEGTSGVSFGTVWQNVPREFGQVDLTANTFNSVGKTYINDTGYYLGVTASIYRNSQDAAVLEVVFGDVNTTNPSANTFIRLAHATNSGGGVLGSGFTIVPPGEKYTFFNNRDGGRALTGITSMNVAELRGPAGGATFSGVAEGTNISGKTYDTGWISSGTNNVTVGNSNTIEIEHNLNSTSLSVDVFVADTASGEGATLVSDIILDNSGSVYGAQVQNIRDTKLDVVLGNGGWVKAGTSTTGYTAPSFTGKYIRVVVQGPSNNVSESGTLTDSFTVGKYSVEGKYTVDLPPTWTGGKPDHVSGILRGDKLTTAYNSWIQIVSYTDTQVTFFIQSSENGNLPDDTYVDFLLIKNNGIVSSSDTLAQLSVSVAQGRQATAEEMGTTSATTGYQYVDLNNPNDLDVGNNPGADFQVLASDGKFDPSGGPITLQASYARHSYNTGTNYGGAIDQCMCYVYKDNVDGDPTKIIVYCTNSPEDANGRFPAYFNLTAVQHATTTKSEIANVQDIMYVGTSPRVANGAWGTTNPIPAGTWLVELSWQENNAYDGVNLDEDVRSHIAKKYIVPDGKYLYFAHKDSRAFYTISDSSTAPADPSQGGVWTQLTANNILESEGRIGTDSQDTAICYGSATKLGTFSDVSTGSGNTVSSSLSAEGALFIIKAVKDELLDPKLTVNFPITATVDGQPITSGAEFNPLLGDVELGVVQEVAAVPPGIEVFDTAGTYTFTTKKQYTKFYVTGSGSTGGIYTGSNAATIIGYLNLPIGTVIDLTVGAGIPAGSFLTSGKKSQITYSGTLLVKSEGAIGGVAYNASNAINTGTLNTTYTVGGNQVVDQNSFIIKGGAGVDTNGGDEESVGPASFWGSWPAPGAGALGDEDNTTPTSDGIVMFEWT